MFSKRVPKFRAGGVRVREIEVIATEAHDVLSRLFGRWVVDGTPGQRNRRKHYINSEKARYLEHRPLLV